MAKKTKGPAKEPPRANIAYYTPSTGRLSGREIKAKKRLDALIEKYKAEGMSASDARERAVKDMRDNGRMDWRVG